MDNGREMDSPTNLIISIGQPSGPGDFPLCKFITLLKTMFDVKSIESVADVEAVVWAVGIVVVSSTVNTLEK